MQGRQSLCRLWQLRAFRVSRCSRDAVATMVSLMQCTRLTSLHVRP